jgi:hypothetical protein
MVPRGKLRASAIEIVFCAGGVEVIGAGIRVTSRVMSVSICNILDSPF